MVNVVSLALAAALRLHGPAVQLHDVPHDCEAEPEPPVGARRRAVGLPEPIEDVGQEVGMDARPVSETTSSTFDTDPREPHADAPALCR